MKKILIYIGVTSAFFLPVSASAQEWLNYVGGTVSILDRYIFWSTLIIVLIAIGMVFSNAYKMKGGVFGCVLTIFGAGMIFTFLGYLTMQFSQVVPGSLADFLPDSLFITGYVLMAIAASRLARAIAK